MSLSRTGSNTPDEGNPFRSKRSLHTVRRQTVNAVAIVLTTLFAMLASLFLLYLIGYVGKQGSQFLNLAFFTQRPAPDGDPGGGVAPAIQGSIILIGLASAVGIPLGLLTGIYLAEFGRGWLAAVTRFMVDTLTGIPTIIFGLFAWVLIVVPTHSFSAVAGGVALGIIMIPTVSRATEEVLRLVPKELREASVALGATESRTIVRVILPAAASGIVTGIILAIARVAGETAPLLLTTAGSVFFFTTLNHPVDALPLRIFIFTLSPYQNQINQAYAASFVLVVLVILASLAVRLAIGGFQRHGR